MAKVEKKITYHPYPLKKPITVNSQKFDLLIISSHYKEEHSSYMTNKKILAIAKQLDKRNDFIPKLKGKLADKTEWQSFFWEPFCYQKKAYRLVWYWEIDLPYLWILHCHRRSKYDKKC